MKRLALVAALAVGLAACAAPSARDKLVNAVQRYGLACDAYASSLNVLALFRAAGQLDQHTIGAVDKIVVLARPICEAEQPPLDNLALLVALEQSVTVLIALKKEVAADAQ